MGKYQTMRDLTESEMDELRKSIKTSGILTPLAFDENGEILDGHHRLAIIKELGISDFPRTIHAGLSEAEKFRFSRDVNVIRRQLTPEEMRAEAAKRLISTPELSDRQIAKRVGASNAFVSKLRHEMESSGQLFTVNSSIGADGKTRPRPVYANTDRQQREATSEVIGRMAANDRRSIHKEHLRIRREEKAERQRITKQITPDDVILRVDDIKNSLLWIEDESIDLILADMPYNKKSVPLAENISKLAARVLRDSGACLVMTGLFYLPEITNLLRQHLDYYWQYCILTPGSATRMPMQHRRIANHYKVVIWCQKGKMQAKDLYEDVIVCPPDAQADKTHHPHGQSLHVFSELVLRHSRPYDLVLDPFNGAGTTGVAAITSGRRYIGTDVDPACIDITRQRLAPLFDDNQSQF
jgi:ParB-like chromosome segregation protein Spo0J